MKYKYRRAYIKAYTESGIYKFVSPLPNFQLNKASRFLGVLRNKSIKQIVVSFQTVKTQHILAYKTIKKETYDDVEKLSQLFKEISQEKLMNRVKRSKLNTISETALF